MANDGFRKRTTEYDIKRFELKMNRMPQARFLSSYGAFGGYRNSVVGTNHHVYPLRAVFPILNHFPSWIRIARNSELLFANWQQYQALHSAKINNFNIENTLIEAVFSLCAMHFVIMSVECRCIGLKSPCWQLAVLHIIAAEKRTHNATDNLMPNSANANNSFLSVYILKLF